MVFNKKKVKEKPLAELQRLQSELETLRAKQLATLEKQLQAIEKSVETQKTKTEKARHNHSEAKQRLRIVIHPGVRIWVRIEVGHLVRLLVRQSRHPR